MRRVGLAVAVAALLLAPLTAQTGNSAWVTWARANHHPIAAVQSFEGDTFDDLQFFKTVLKDRRIVQLGESGHGVAEFNHAKVRLIKFLHQQMGYDVIAFESGLFECYNANATASLNAATLMRNCIFAVWHTNEVLPLFEYIKETQSTSRPLMLAGFDTQISSPSGITFRPMFFADLVRAIDPGRATQVATRDGETITAITTSFSTASAYAVANQARHTEFYGGLELFFEEHRAALQERFGAEAPIIAQRAAWSMLRYLEQLRAGTRPASDPESGGAIRDFGMANNLTFLANDLYPGRKIMAWAHNFHIRHDNAATTSVQPTMGQWVRERFRDQLYTVGLYMDRGSAAQNNRAIYSINPALPNTMEWIMANAGSPTLFIDFLHQQRGDGNAWMFNATTQREWGVTSFTMVPRNQYDGVLFIDVVKSPSYVQ